jgi:hypothetical protein
MRQTGLFPRIYQIFFSYVHIEGHTALEPDPETELRSRSGKVLPRCTPCVLRMLEIKKCWNTVIFKEDLTGSPPPPHPQEIIFLILQI